MMKRRVLLLVLLVGISGCGGSIDEESVTPPSVTPKDAIKAALEQVVQTGQAGSEIGGVMGDIEKLKSDDPATAAAMEQGVNELMTIGASNPAQAKKKAQELLQKLNAGGTRSG